MEVAPIVLSFISGGLGGSLATEYFRRKRSLTLEIPLIERMNRDPISPDLRGIRFFRGPDGAAVEVKNLREYQMTLRNSTETDLHGAQIQFEFHGTDVEAWASKTRRAHATLQAQQAPPTAEPSLLLKCWNFAQFPAGDSVEFGFLVIEPTQDGYDATLLNTNNIVIRIWTEEPPPDRLPARISLAVAITIVLVCLLLATWLWHSLFGH